MVRVVIAGALITCAACAACSSSGRGSFSDDPAGLDGGSFAQDASAPPSLPPGEVFGHSENTLFRVNTDTREVTQVGYFQRCTYVADIALDESSHMYASTGTDLYVVNTNTAECTKIASGTFPNSLSFVPAGTLDTTETLVGYQGGSYVRIDPKTGTVTKVGDLGGGFESSGDVVSTKGGKTYLSVKGPNCADCLVEIDPKTGALTKNWGSLGHADVFGLAFWAGDVYAFTNSGEIFLVEFTGDTLKVTPISVANPPAGLKFWGAGSTTSAPVGPVH